VREQGARQLAGKRDAQANPADLAVEGRRRSGSPLAALAGGGRAAAIAFVSTAVVFTGLGLAIVFSPGWNEIRKAFFDGHEFASTFPGIASAFLLNVKIFSIAEVLILVIALGVAVVRSLPGPVFFPFRALAIVYADFFRGVPTILVITLLGFGAPALGLKGVPTSETFWGIVALVLVYTAYVSEVYRAGIESIHPSQEAAARSIGLSRGQALRFVVLPQAVRRVVPPLLNDFIGLQKDTALVGVLGAVEAFKQTQIDQAATFNFTSGVAAAVLFVAVTVPLTRLTDWLISRDRRRRQSGVL
jgi:polar amino acid transport system permease protein